MSFSVIIPARFASTRLPGKPLADIAGKPMVVHVIERCLASAAARVLVATDDEQVADAVEKSGGEAIMTRADHVSGTDRLQEVAELLGLPDEHILVNVQGDEPLIPAAVINQVADNLAGNEHCAMATLCEPIERDADLFNPNIVKVVRNANQEALYFSRAPVPWHRDEFAKPSPTLHGDCWRRHIGIYAYRVGFLHRYITWPVAPLEQVESLEQLRAMHHGVRIHVADACEAVPGGVDTEQDLQRMRAVLAGSQ